MTYNIHVGIPASGSTPNLAATAAVINAASPDLVALQEVDKNTTRSGGVDQAAYLATATGMNYYFAKAINRFGGEYGIAILWCSWRAESTCNCSGNGKWEKNLFW
ncbi:hypothetical protein D3C85_1072220 [compost metagenome]